MGSKLLPPIEAVQIAWARTGEFSNDPHSQQYALQAEATLKDIVKRAAEKPYQGVEQEYVWQASALIDSSLRALDTIYKGRDLDFKENAKLRESSLDSAKSILKFGSEAKDYLKALPGTALGGTLGVGIASIVNVDDTLALSLLGVGVGMLGYFVNVWALHRYRKKMEKYYVRQDYDRSLYFERYVNRTEIALQRLYRDLQRAENEAFGKEDRVIDIPQARIEAANLLASIRPSLCPKIHDHMREGKVDAKHWPLCETGGPNKVTGVRCEYWEGEVPEQIPGRLESTVP